MSYIDNYDDSKSEISPEIVDGIRSISHTDDTSSKLLTERFMVKMGSFHGMPRKMNSFTSMQSYMHLNRPLSSLESCLLAQIYKEHAKMEENASSSLPFPSERSLRPFFVADGGHIISTMSDSYFNGTDENKQVEEVSGEQDEKVFGIPALPKVVLQGLSKKMEFKKGKLQSKWLSILSEMVNGKHSHLRGDGVFLFCLGISIGIIFSVVTNRREVENLREVLNQTENLVQDLQEELEMKDEITVKELANEDYDSRGTCDYSLHNRVPEAISPAQDPTKLAKYDGAEELHEERMDKNSEHRRTIELELEAELERLELTMNPYSLEKGLPDLVELDPDFVANVIHGDLRADMFARGASTQSDQGHCRSNTSTPHTATYAVSPRELSLHLHEVIQSRLEERIRELEAALAESQRKVKDLELKQIYCWRELADDELGSSSSSEDPHAKEDAFCKDHKRLTETYKSEGAYANSCAAQSVYLIDQRFNNSPPCHVTKRNSQVNAFREERWNDSYATSDDGDADEMEKLLIKQIMERTRQGSPALLNAQRAFFSMAENEH